MSTPNTDREAAPADTAAEHRSRNSTGPESPAAPTPASPSPASPSPGPQIPGPEILHGEAGNHKNADHPGTMESSASVGDVLPEIVSPGVSPSGKQKNPFGEAASWHSADLPIVDAVFESVAPRKRPASDKAAAPAERWSVLLPTRSPDETNAAPAQSAQADNTFVWPAGRRHDGGSRGDRGARRIADDRGFGVHGGNADGRAVLWPGSLPTAWPGLITR